ncbi:hypothetical protein CONCODRAFT_60509 [Conidiobolus coronatus NRRL 28638]|uniref:tRNA pseudouridine(55) synthase n=1 Tax=Conidiobolus coronatus (strain ATCC 28846 / CBS 209.66 / NRRL 28638) TaxID=796925 RepID=A0A137NZ15_CONC2|nr:hypothetical protein CONCODRAFT_60509 [Conidiobolus coronatus NRRL 28638]|eukprot:KXN68065.1 hypothetical protein CONCODRAFT_60509 [Conidiobolus coronatus NRRL 28638]
MTLEDLEQVGIYPPSVDYTSHPCITSLTWSHKPIYLAGRYLKLDRATSQTPFFVGSRKLCEHSVSDSFKPVLSHFKGSSYNMVPSGREDMDVRMLGSGRPFYLEIKNPKLTNMDNVNFKGLQNLINNVHLPVEVRELCGIQANQVQTIKLGEESKSKYYRALIWCAKNRSELTELKLEVVNKTPSALGHLRQGTPVRVSHRRAAGNRSKNIYDIKITPLSDHLIQAEIHAQAGTYIKELVHGDLGRTQPNISSFLGCACELLELDVIHVDLNWPPSKSDPHSLSQAKRLKVNNMLNQQ